MRRTLLLFALFLLVASPASAADFSDPAQGWSFDAPEGWVGRAQDGGVVLGSNTVPGLVVVQPHTYGAVSELRTAAQEGWYEDGVALQLGGELEAFGDNGLLAPFKGTVGGERAKAVAIGLISPHGGGLIVVSVAAESASTDTHRTVAEAIARSVRFSAPQTPDVVTEWTEWFADRRLTYMWSYDSGVGVDGSYAGGSQKTVIDLCSSGRFWYHDSNSMSIDGGTGYSYQGSVGGGGSESGHGAWEIVAQGREPYLVLRFQDGETWNYHLTYEDNKTYLGDQRFFVTSGSSGIADQTPDCW